MELRHLHVFEAVAREGSVVGAAAAVGRAPSSVSESIRSLERYLGVALFERSGNRMRLSAAGQRLLPLAQDIHERVDEARRRVKTGDVEVRLGALETLMAEHVPGIIRRLADRNPDIVVRPSVTSDRSRLLAELQSGNLDAGLILDAGAALGQLGFAPPAKDLEIMDLGTVRSSLVVGRSHPLAVGNPVTDSAVARYPIIGATAACAFWLAASLLPFEWEQRIEAGSVGVAKAWSMQGMGLALLPDFMIGTELAAGDLIPLRVPTPTLSVRLVWDPEREDRPGVRALLYSASRLAPV